MALILNEIEKDLHFKVIVISNEKFLESKIKDLKDYLIITKNKNLKFKNQFIINNFPIRVFKLLEQLNVQFLKINFFENSQIKFGNYTIDLNSREIFLQKFKLKLTEKEVNTIIYLYKSSSPVSIHELQSRVWGYHLNIETHTVETHIYRLRKKISQAFKDENFIISNIKGYELRK